MIQAGIKEIKNNLSRYLARVKDGEEVMITERGKAIARIVKENSKNMATRETLSPWIDRGVVIMPSTGPRREAPVRYKATGKSVAEMVIEDRR